MKALMVEPRKESKEMEITNDLHLLQQLVGGLIEVHPVDGIQGALIICNEEGKLQNLPMNRPLYMTDERGRDRLYDFVHGNFLIVAEDGEEFGGLSEEQLALCKQRFKTSWGTVEGVLEAADQMRI